MVRQGDRTGGVLHEAGEHALQHHPLDAGVWGEGEQGGAAAEGDVDRQRTLLAVGGGSHPSARVAHQLDGDVPGVAGAGDAQEGAGWRRGRHR
jgi:hypothetical protein